MADANKHKPYTVHILPKSGELFDSCVDRYTELRLQLLRNVGTALTGKYDVESTFTRDQWCSYLSNPRRIVIVCVQSEAGRETDNKEQALRNGVWVGMSLLLGPFPLGDWTWPNCGLRGDDEETRWHSGGSYVLDAHRGGKLLELMIAAVHSFAKEQTHRMLGAHARRIGRQALYHRIRFAIDGSHPELVGFYRKFFQAVSAGIVTHAEMFDAMELGYKDSDTVEAGAQANQALVMEVVQQHAVDLTESTVRPVVMAKL